MYSDYQYLPISYEDLIKFESNLINEDNVKKYIPSYVLFATPKRREVKSLEFIRDKIERVKIKYYLKFNNGESLYIGPVVNRNSFQLFYINYNEGLFISLPDFLKGCESVTSIEVNQTVINAKKYSFKEKVEISPFFLKIEIFSMWIKSVNSTESYNDFIESFKVYMLDVYKFIDFNMNDILYQKLKDVLNRLNSLNTLYNSETIKTPKRLYSFLITDKYMHANTIHEMIYSSHFKQFIWWETPEEAIANNKKNYHIGTIIQCKLFKKTGDLLNLDRMFIGFKDSFVYIKPYAPPMLNINDNPISHSSSIKLEDYIPLSKFGKMFCDDIYTLLVEELIPYKLIPDKECLYIDEVKQIYYIDKKRDIICPLYFIKEPQTEYKYIYSKKRNAIELNNLYSQYEKRHKQII